MSICSRAAKLYLTCVPWMGAGLAMSICSKAAKLYLACVSWMGAGQVGIWGVAGHVGPVLVEFVALELMVL